MVLISNTISIYNLSEVSEVIRNTILATRFGARLFDGEYSAEESEAERWAGRERSVSSGASSIGFTLCRCKRACLTSAIVA